MLGLLGCTIGVPNLRKAVTCIAAHPLLAFLQDGRGEIKHSLVSVCLSNGLVDAGTDKCVSAPGRRALHMPKKEASVVSELSRKPCWLSVAKRGSERHSSVHVTQRVTMGHGSLPSACGSRVEHAAKGHNNGCHTVVIEGKDLPADSP